MAQYKKDQQHSQAKDMAGVGDQATIGVTSQVRKINQDSMDRWEQLADEMKIQSTNIGNGTGQLNVELQPDLISQIEELKNRKLFEALNSSKMLGGGRTTLPAFNEYQYQQFYGDAIQTPPIPQISSYKLYTTGQSPHSAYQRQPNVPQLPIFQGRIERGGNYMIDQRINSFDVSMARDLKTIQNQKMRSPLDKPFAGGLVPVKDILHKTLGQVNSNQTTQRRNLNPLMYEQPNNYNMTANTTHMRNRSLQPSFNNLQQSLTLGPEHHLVTNAMNVRTFMPPNVKKNKKQQQIQEDIQQPYRQFMKSRNYHKNMTGHDSNRLTAFTQDSGSNNYQQLEVSNRWLMQPHTFNCETPLQGSWMQQPSVKSPFERKPGMKMSTYAGDKRKDKIRYYLQDTFLGNSQSPRNSIDDNQDSIMNPSIDEMDSTKDGGDGSPKVMLGEHQQQTQRKLKLKVTSTDKAIIARQLDQIRFNQKAAIEQNPEYPGTLALDPTRDGVNRATLHTEPSKLVHTSIEHWDPHGKYTFQKKHGANRKRLSMERDAAKEVTTTQQSDKVTPSILVEPVRGQQKTVAVENVKMSQVGDNQSSALRKHAKTAKLRKRQNNNSKVDDMIVKLQEHASMDGRGLNDVQKAGDVMMNQTIRDSQSYQTPADYSERDQMNKSQQQPASRFPKITRIKKHKLQQHSMLSKKTADKQQIRQKQEQTKSPKLPRTQPIDIQQYRLQTAPSKSPPHMPASRMGHYGQEGAPGVAVAEALKKGADEAYDSFLEEPTISKFTEEINQDLNRSIVEIDTSQGKQYQPDPYAKNGFTYMDLESVIEAKQKQIKNQKIIVNDQTTAGRSKKDRGPIRQLIFSPQGQSSSGDPTHIYTAIKDVENTLKLELAKRKVRDQYLNALKNTSMVLTDMNDQPENKPVYSLKPFIPQQIPMKVYIQEYAQIDIWGKLEPAIIKISGWREDLNVFMSTSEKYPDAKNSQATKSNEGKIEFYVRGNPDSKQYYKFQKSQLFLCFESSHEVSLKVVVSFGGEDKAKTQATIELQQEKKGMMQDIKDEFNRQNKDGDRDIVKTAARSANEHQKRIKVQVEKMINNEKEAKQYLNKVRDQQEQEKNQIILERDFISENRADAAVWQDLDLYQRAETQGLKNLRIHQTLQRKEMIDFDKRKELENKKIVKAQVAEVRAFIQDIFERQRRARFSLQTFVTLIALDRCTRTLARNFYGRVHALQMRVAMIIAISKITGRFKRTLRKRGRNVTFRIQNQLRYGLTNVSRNVLGYQETRAASVMHQFLVTTQPIADIQRLFKEFRKGVMHIQRQFKLYFSNSQDQKFLLGLFLKREIERLGFCCTKSSEPQLKTLGIKLQVIPPEKLEAIVKKYVTKCKHRTQDEFWAWRTKVHELMNKNYYDERLNIRQPMAMPRVVWSLDEIDYDSEVKLSDNMLKFLERMYEETSRNYHEYLKESVLDEVKREEKYERQYQSQVEEGQKQQQAEKQQLLRLRTIKRKSAMEEMSKRKQTKEDMQQLQMLSDDNVRTKLEELNQGKKPFRFPDRPVTKFIPCRIVMYHLLLEAVLVSFPTLETELGEFKCKKRN